MDLVRETLLLALLGVFEKSKYSTKVQAMQQQIGKLSTQHWLILEKMPSIIKSRDSSHQFTSGFFSISGGSSLRDVVGFPRDLAGIPSLLPSILVQIPPSLRTNRFDVLGLLYHRHVVGTIRSNLSDFALGMRLLQWAEIPCIHGLHRRLSYPLLHPQIFRGMANMNVKDFPFLIIFSFPAATSWSQRI